MDTDGVKLLSFPFSPFAMRARIALSLKGIKYELQDEDILGTKSELLLKSNPIYKKVPVLIDNGKPICESLIILNYIDEQWPTPPLLPQGAYEKSVARFWADFSDKKLWDSGSKIWKTKGEEQAEAKKEFLEAVKTLEGALGDKEYFNGDSFGFTDIAIIGIASWFPGFEQYGNFKLEDESPIFSAWIKRSLEIESVATVLPPPSQICDVVAMLRKMNGIE